MKKKKRTTPGRNKESPAKSKRSPSPDLKKRLDAEFATAVVSAKTYVGNPSRLQALFGYNSSLAEFDRVTGAQSTYSEQFDSIAPHATKRGTYYTGSDVDARGRPKRTNPFQPGPVTTTTTISEQPSSK